MIYYFIVISSSLIVFLSELVSKINIKYIIISIALIVPITFGAIRYGIGTDYFSYVNIYYNITSENYTLFQAITETRYEPGWVLLNYIVKYIFDNVQYVFVISSLMTWFFCFKALFNNKGKLSIGLATFIALATLFNISFNTIRQTLAITIILLSVKPLIDKKTLKFVFIVILATLFHYTAIIFLPTFWIVNGKTKKFNTLKQGIVLIIFFILIIKFESIMSITAKYNILSTYDSFELEKNNFDFLTLISRAPILIIILWNLKKLKVSHNPVSKLAILYFIGFILLFLSSYALHINRIARYFEVMQIFILPSIVNIQSNKYKKLFYTFIIIAYYFSLFTISFLIKGQQGTIPYNWIF